MTEFFCSLKIEVEGEGEDISRVKVAEVEDTACPERCAAPEFKQIDKFDWR